MRKATSENHIQQLKQILKKFEEEVAVMEKDQALPMFYERTFEGDDRPIKCGPYWSVSWGSRGSGLIEFDNHELSREDTMNMAANAFGALFDSQRGGSDPSDPETFKQIMDQFVEKVQHKCNQR